ncbi:hypothetical protein NY057_08385 [Curtobacterium flaccumfaciens]|uniref:hypothetical protein n=1 Tax=Curtobacterium flaccumfaciens TaxID=2035 RepID=UPI0022023C02|nr:hypothetical protein [Curtobacterium flaccumfaciens]UWD84243.1 hypothetical protein NY057_08385 [Curtobacterium flaccumfaciens]
MLPLQPDDPPPLVLIEESMLTATASPRRRLLLQVLATLALLLLVGFTVLMHTMAGHTAGHEHPMAAPAATTEHVQAVGNRHGEHAAPAAAVLTVLTDAGCDSGLCALMCSLMGMACALTIALFAWALLRARTGGVLALLSRLLALADRLPRHIAAPKPPSLTALQIIRI